MPYFSKTFTGLSEAASVVLHWRPSSDTAGNYLQYSNGRVNMNGTYTASFSYEYDVEYTWSLYYGQYGSATSYIDGGTVYTASPPPSPLYNASRTLTTATASISNLSIDDEVEFTISLHANNLYVASDSDIATGTTMTLSVSGLVRDTKYAALVTVNGKSLGYQTLEPISPDFDISYTATSATVTVINLIENEKVEFSLSEGANGTNAQSASGTAKGESLNLSINGLTPNTYYTYSVKVNGKNIRNDYFITLDASQIEDFKWTTNIYQWAKMASWQHPAGGHTHPAPVTAKEWNELVEIVNAKCGTNINKVSTSTPMRAGPGGNVRQVADALGVKVDKGYRITAQFFLDLQDAVNNIK